MRALNMSLLVLSWTVSQNHGLNQQRAISPGNPHKNISIGPRTWLKVRDTDQKDLDIRTDPGIGWEAPGTGNLPQRLTASWLQCKMMMSYHLLNLPTRHHNRLCMAVLEISYIFRYLNKEGCCKWLPSLNGRSCYQYDLAPSLIQYHHGDTIL